VQQEDVRKTLAELLAWEEMQRSPQLARFLGYIVEQKLAGNEQNIKAYAIAVDVFGRSHDFDPQSDPIVRVQARRLRSLLERFYARADASAPVHIRLPVGRYVPDFEPVSSMEEPGVSEASPLPPIATEMAGSAHAVASIAAAGSSGRGWLGLAALGAVVVLAIVGSIGLENDWFDIGLTPAAPAAPVVRVANFTNETGLSNLDGFADELGHAVAKDIAGYPDVTLAAPGSPPVPGTLTVSGTLQAKGNGFQLTAALADADSDGDWSTVVDIPAPGQSWAAPVADAARTVVGRLGTFRGPLHRVGRAWIEQQRGVEARPTTYTCLLRFRAAGEQEKAVGDGDVFSCLDRLLREDPGNVAALAAQGWLDESRVPGNGVAGDRDLDHIMAMMDKAVALGPQSGFAHAFRARVLGIQGRHAEAVAEFVAALALSPADLDTRASYAKALVESGNWTAGAAEANAALVAAPLPPPWYYLVPMLDAYRRGDWGAAVDDALAFATADRDIGAAVAVAAAAHAGRMTVVARYLPAILTSPRFRSDGILMHIDRAVGDTGMSAAIGDGLVLAGVPQGDLRHSF